MSVKEIQYINKDYCILFSKPVVYLHYMTHMDKYPQASYQYVLKREPFTEEDTVESIIQRFKDYVHSVVNVSKRCKLLVFIHDFQLEYPNIIDDMEVYPDFEVKSYDISNRNDSMPDCGVVWEINKISPKICGILFENIISHIMEIDDKCYDLSNTLSSHSSNISTQTLEGIIERNFIKRKLIHKGSKVRISGKKVVYLGDERLCEDDFISLWHYLIYLSLRHFIKRDLVGEDVEDCLKILDYVNENLNYMDDYYYEMMDSTFIKNLKKETNLKHGEVFRSSELHGELDFMSDSSIVDIKSYKNEEIPCWFAQLYLYERLSGGGSDGSDGSSDEHGMSGGSGGKKRKVLKIVNVYSNLVYEFSYVE